MTGHQINDLATSFVEMAKAYERLPQVEAELAAVYHELNNSSALIASVRCDLEQSRSYAASLEAKVHAAEASRDDAELRFLELDERAAKAVRFLGQVQGLAVQAEIELAPPTPAGYSFLPIDPQPEPIVSEVKPIQAEETVQHFDDGGPYNEPINLQQGQSEADPTATHFDPLAVSEGSVAAENTTGMQPSWATPTPPKPQPYAGKTWTEIGATANHYIGYNEWKEGGGSDENWNS